MKKFLKFFISAVLALIILAIIFCMIDSYRVHNDQEPIFTFNHKILDGIDYSAKVDVGLGYKIIRFDYLNQPEEIRIGSIFMSESPNILDNGDSTSGDVVQSGDYELNSTETISGDNVSGDEETAVDTSSGESGEKEIKLTTFGEKFIDKIMIEGQEEEVYAQPLNSKVGYSIDFYFELFEYSGFGDHDKYKWNATSGDVSSVMIINSLSGEELYNKSLESTAKSKSFEEVSGDFGGKIQRAFSREYEENDVKKVNNVYYMVLDDLRFMVDVYMPLEAQEGVGKYFDRMINSVRKTD